jgi:hypothetical protein
MATTLKKEDGQLVRAATGRMIKIEGQEKLSQDVGDMLMSDYNPARGTGCQILQKSKDFPNIGIMDSFGDAILARYIEDGVQRLSNQLAVDPRANATERIDTGKTTVQIKNMGRRQFYFLISVVPLRGSAFQVPYRTRFRHQYPGVAARDVFPKGIVTDDSVPL